MIERICEFESNAFMGMEIVRTCKGEESSEYTGAYVYWRGIVDMMQYLEILPEGLEIESLDDLIT